MEMVRLGERFWESQSTNRNSLLISNDWARSRPGFEAVGAAILIEEPASPGDFERRRFALEDRAVNASSIDLRGSRPRNPGEDTLGEIVGPFEHERAVEEVKLLDRGGRLVARFAVAVRVGEVEGFENIGQPLPADLDRKRSGDDSRRDRGSPDRPTDLGQVERAVHRQQGVTPRLDVQPASIHPSEPAVFGVLCPVPQPPRAPGWPGW